MASEESIWAAAHDPSNDHEVLKSHEHSQGVWVVTLNDPKTHNTLTPTMMGAIARELDRLKNLEPEKVKVIILNANGRSFCAGIDINSIRDDPDFAELWTREIDPFYAVQQSRAPIIGCVQGAAMTGGFEIAMSCDVVIASKDACFRDNHAMYGVHAIRGLSQLLPRICGPSNAKLAIMASMPVPASKALAWNLISEVVETPDDLLPAALRIARGITYNSPKVVRALKVSLKEGYAMTFGDAERRELKSNEDYFASIGSEQSKVLDEGAARFNERVRELDAPAMKMLGGMAD